MTTIVRHNDTLYFDNLLLIASHQGGTFANAKQPKVYKHPSFNAFIGISGALEAGHFNSMEAAINQWLVDLTADIHAPIKTGALDKIVPTTSITIGVFCKDFTLVINHNQEPGDKWNVYKHPTNRIMVIGSGSAALNFADKFEAMLDVDPISVLKAINRIDVFTTLSWCKLDISKLEKL